MFGSRREAKTYQKGVFEIVFVDRYVETRLLEFFWEGI